MKQESLETKLTLRISKEELDDMDEFLSLNERFPSRSEFIRHSVQEYIARSRVIVESTRKQSLELSDNLDRLIETAVQNGLFKSKIDAVVEILERAFLDGEVDIILKTKMENYSKLMEQIRNFEDTKRKLEDSKQGKLERTR